VVAEFAAIGQAKHQGIAGSVAWEGLTMADAPGEHGVDEQERSVVEGKEQEFAPALYSNESLAHEMVSQTAAYQIANQQWPANLGRVNGHIYNAGGQELADYFQIRQLGHLFPSPMFDRAGRACPQLIPQRAQAGDAS
jgi:hypothetical protein